MPSYVSIPRKAQAAPIAGTPERKPDLATLKKDDLVALARERGLDTSGNKVDLVERLA